MIIINSINRLQKFHDIEVIKGGEQVAKVGGGGGGGGGLRPSVTVYCDNCGHMHTAYLGGSLEPRPLPFPQRWMYCITSTRKEACW